jgi:NAD(P)-dependent dehydrogenase (short-subunit alcohol dehydrogenase family)
MAGSMKGKVALVTGGGEGIGRGTALAFAREGAAVAVADIDAGLGEATVRMIKQVGGEAVYVPCDVTQSADVRAMVENTVKSLGRLDYAFNNAGVQTNPLPIADYPEEWWHRVVNTDLTGVWLCMKYEIPQMLKQGKGAIVNTASVAGLIGTPGITAYTAAKHGVIGLTKTVALEYATAGIRVNAVCPGAIKTRLVDRIIKETPEMEKFLMEAHPVGRFGVVEEVAGAVVWLCSDVASFVTGHSMVIDGGMTAR